MDELNQNLNNLVQQVQLLLAAQQQPAQQAQQPAAPQPTYALSPARTNADQFIDYTTADGKKLFKAATEPLSIKFDVEGKNVNMFNELLLTRANMAGWDSGQGDILTIPDANGNDRNLITEYGRLTMEEITTHVRTYVLPAQGQQAPPANRRAQNDYQLFLCLSTSLTEAGHIKLLAERDRYTINGHRSGSLYFKLLMKKAIIDTRATASQLRTNLINLDSYMNVVDSNIRLFNQYVKINSEGLKARGESNDDLMVNLFRGYMQAMDQEFVKYIKDKKNSYDEGADIDADRLMELALNKYENLVTEGQWRALTPADEKLEALNATVDKLKDENLRLSKSLKTKQQKGKGDQESKNKNKPKKKPNKNKKRQNEDMSWKKKPPKEGEPTTKQVQNNTWHWCLDHLAWVLHHPSECRLAQERAKNNKSTANQQRRTTLNQALNTILEEFNSDDE
jgi:hypothetical protein